MPSDGPARPASAAGPTEISLLGLTGLPEVGAGDDLSALILHAAGQVGGLHDGDIVVVSSKVVSKAKALWADSADRDGAIRAHTLRIVAERTSGARVTQVVEALAGPVMAAAGVDASNTGDRDEVLLLPSDPDAEASELRDALLAGSGLDRLGVLLSDTAGRPWRSGQTDFALGASGVEVVDDLRGRDDADGRPLAVTTRAIADELAAAADLVKGKTATVPVAIVRGTPWATSGSQARQHSPGTPPKARDLVRTGPEDWFALGHVEAVRAALGTAPGADAALVGIPAAGPEERGARLGRAVAVALRGLESVGADVGASDVRLSAGSPVELGRAIARLEVSLWAEGLAGEVGPLGSGTGLAAEVTVSERSVTSGVAQRTGR